VGDPATEILREAFGLAYCLLFLNVRFPVLFLAANRVQKFRKVWGRFWFGGKYNDNDIQLRKVAV